ncbi:MAG: hypothetical protein JJU13_10895 [Balneolaceae bacterium]|nr:hypothetical protein [Balneolaceae bacterium]
MSYQAPSNTKEILLRFFNGCGMRDAGCGMRDAGCGMLCHKFFNLIHNSKIIYIPSRINIAAA